MLLSRSNDYKNKEWWLVECPVLMPVWGQWSGGLTSSMEFAPSLVVAIPLSEVESLPEAEREELLREAQLLIPMENESTPRGKRYGQWKTSCLHATAFTPSQNCPWCCGRHWWERCYEGVSQEGTDTFKPPNHHWKKTCEIEFGEDRENIKVTSH